MLKKYFKIVFGILATLVFNIFYRFQVARASTAEELNKQLWNAGDKGWGEGVAPGSVNDLPHIIQYVISAFLSLLGVIFLVLIIYAGYNWMTAQGEEEKVTKAKDTLTRAIIGLIIIIAAYSITYFVFSSLSGGGTGGGGAPINTGGEKIDV